MAMVDYVGETRVTQLISGCISQGPGRIYRAHSNGVILSGFNKVGAGCGETTRNSVVLYRATWACERERKAQLPEPKKRDLQSEAMAARRDLGNQGN